MLFHIYDRLYTDALAGVVNKPLFYVHVFMAADKYDVKALKSRVVEDFSDFTKVYWNDENFVQAISEGYDLPAPGNDRGLNSTIEEICSRNITVLIQKPSFVDVLKAFPELQIKIIQATVDLISNLRNTIRVSAIDKAIPVAYICTCGAQFTKPYFSGRRTSTTSKKGHTVYHWFSCPDCPVTKSSSDFARTNSHLYR